jgi:hypothetical protein
MLRQAWAYRYYVSADSISYLDMSDAIFPGAGWDRLITGTWSPLYPFLLGSARLLSPNPYHEVALGHLLNVLILVGALGAFEFFLRNAIPRGISVNFAQIFPGVIRGQFSLKPMILRQLTDATKVSDTELSAQKEIRAHLRLDIDANHLSLISHPK